MSEPTPVVPPSAATRRRRRRRLLLGLVPLLVLAAAALLYLSGGRYVSTDNAYLKADKVPISADVAGTVRQVLVRENQAVAAGTPLYRLDPQSFELAAARAEARLAQVRTDLVALKAGYGEKRAEIELARSQLAYARKEQQRQANLLQRQLIAASSYDDAAQRADLAALKIDALAQDLTRIAEQLGGDASAPVEQHPRYRAALAELQQARLDLARVEVRAPLAGVVSRLPTPGQYLNAGATALALVVTGDIWIEANFTETELTHIRPGQPVAVAIDSYPDGAWQGVVESISPATGAEFALLPAQNSSGNWVKIAQRLPVRIRLQVQAEQPPLRAGLSAEVAVDTGRRRTLLGLTL